MKEKLFYKEILKNHLGSSIQITSIQPVPGGCINTAIKIDTSKGVFFIKTNSENQKDLFQKEEKGLKVLRQSSTISIPEIHGSGNHANMVYLILEWVETGYQSQGFWEDFGQRLALQHRVTADEFGLDHDNHIGLLTQQNSLHYNWYDFFIQTRLLPQINLAEQKGLIDSETRNQFDVLFKKLDRLIPKPEPSLLHGDLWSGNFLCGPGSSPYIFDPAVHFGHRETELAFTSLFGGFDSTFYSAYNHEFELEPGFSDRIDIHNLYPLLVHVNLFGPSYLAGIQTTLSRFSDYR